MTDTTDTGEMERYVEIRSVVIEGEPEACNVFLKIGVQSFCVTPRGCENREHAEWMRDQLCRALANLVAEATAAEPQQAEQ